MKGGTFKYAIKIPVTVPNAAQMSIAMIATKTTFNGFISGKNLPE